MILYPVSEKDSVSFNRKLEKIFEYLPDEIDENASKPDGYDSNIVLLIISPFDHWLSYEEAELEIRAFSTNPTPELLNRFRKNQDKSLIFLRSYLKEKTFFFYDTNSFYTCDLNNDFFNEYVYSNFLQGEDSFKSARFFLPELDMTISLRETYSITFHIRKPAESKMEEILNIAEKCNLYVNKNETLNPWE